MGTRLEGVMSGYEILAATFLALHLLWIVWVIAGVVVTRGRPALAAVHVASLLFGIMIETGPWPCPLTLAEQWAQEKAGITPYQEGFIIHYLEALVYPDVPQEWLTRGAVAVCLALLGVYGRRWWRWKRGRAAIRRD